MGNRAALLLACLCIASPAADRCPWMNAATAGGLLGGEVTFQVTHPSAIADDASCAFERKQGDAVSTLKIEVTTMQSAKSDFRSYLAQCPSGTRLTAIGNEAVQCGATVVGRVRDRAFVVRVSNTDDAPEKARKAAEHVAGTLF